MESKRPLKILVTGASGFIGTSLVPKLVATGHQVRTMGRSSSMPKVFKGLALEHKRGDVTNPEHVQEAVEGSDVVYHLAGLVSYKKRDQNRQYAVNVLGTRNIMDACLRNNVKRVIHTSSVAAMGIPAEGQLGDEDFEYNLHGLGLSYCDTKHEAELEVNSFVRQGLPVIMLNPGIIFGEGDTHPHHHVIFGAMAKGWALGVPPGGVPFSDINDVVAAHVYALDHGRTGERYVLVSANLTMREAGTIFSKIFGTRAPVMEIPGPLLVGLGTLVEATFPLFGLTPALSRQVAWLSQYKIFFSSRKAEEELDFHATPFSETIRRTSPYYLGKVKSNGQDKTATEVSV
ncbi:MAG: NAD-dependent epimerase/dehydratase family protein [Candidatus Melainabacteria bacterium]|nr:NAD-dependent epimerase/dehydratase family protein [Candidatus Melainabacteria bacterium]